MDRSEELFSDPEIQVIKTKADRNKTIRKVETILFGGLSKDEIMISTKISKKEATRLSDNRTDADRCTWTLITLSEWSPPKLLITIGELGDR